MQNIKYKSGFAGFLAAFRYPMGTNGNQDSQGWWSNVKDLGESQWRKAMKIDGGMKLFLRRTGTCLMANGDDWK